MESNGSEELMLCKIVAESVKQVDSKSDASTQTQKSYIRSKWAKRKRKESHLKLRRSSEGTSVLVKMKSWCFGRCDDGDDDSTVPLLSGPKGSKRRSKKWKAANKRAKEELREIMENL